MILWVYRYLRGYLTVEFYGEKAEHILNLTAKNRINLWGLRCTKRKIIGSVSIKDFFRLHGIIFGHKIRVHILKKGGLPFLIKRYDSRIGFYLGAVIFFAILKIMSSYIWVINIEGNKMIKESEILACCREIGIFEGIKTKTIDSKNDAVQLVLQNEDIAWASLNIEGSVLNINISETKGKETDKLNKPSNLKAGCDGIITKIDVTSGDVLVKTGDVVKKGDLLVSGIVDSLNSTVFSKSSGTITAHTNREFSAVGKKTQKIAESINKVKKHSVLKFFNLKIPLFLGEIRAPSNTDYYETNAVLFDRRIPVSVITKKSNLIEYKTKKYTADQLIKMLENDIENKVEKSDLKVVEMLQETTEEFDDKICVKRTYLCEENIAVEDAILINSLN